MLSEEKRELYFSSLLLLGKRKEREEIEMSYKGIEGKSVTIGR
jgi:hypothetical protein